MALQPLDKTFLAHFRMMSFVLVVALLFTACQPTPKAEVIVNRGDDTFEMRINDSSASSPAAIVQNAEDDPLLLTSMTETDIPDKWEDVVETAALTIHINADIIKNSGPHPVRKIKRRYFNTEEIDRIAEKMLSPVTGVWNSIQISYQEWEQEIGRLNELGLSEMAKESFNQMMESDPPHEEFSPTDHVSSGFRKTEQTYRQINGRYGTVYADDTVLCINTTRRGVPNTETSLGGDGRYEGEEGPIMFSPSLSKEEAEEKTYAFLKDVGLEAYKICIADKASYFAHFTEYSQGWFFTLVSPHEYIPVDMISYGGGVNVFRYDTGDIYRAPWNLETIHVYVSEHGVEYFLWSAPVEVTELVNPDVRLLSFTEVEERIKIMMRVGLSWLNDRDEPMGSTVQLSKVLLTEAPVSVRYESNCVYLVPAWVCVLDWYGPTGSLGRTEYACFNAVDASPIILWG